MPKNRYVLPVLLLLLLAAPPTARSQDPGNCTLGSASADLDENAVRARLYNNGGLFWRGSGNTYAVPKDGETDAIFASGIWIGGRDESGALRFAGTRYGPWEFWPGPLNEGGALPTPNDCTAFDRMFKVSRADVERYEQTGEATADLRDWPAHFGAPVVDGDGDPDNYDLAAGDRPELLGDQVIWWMMNDVGNVKEWTKTKPIPMEVQVTAYAFDEDGPLANTTFYRYKLIYRGTAPFEDAYFGVWSDTDVGHAADDYVGSDPRLDLGFAYNGDDVDEGTHGYGTRPPALGYTFLQTPPADADGFDNDHDGTVDEAGEQLGLSTFIYPNNDHSIVQFDDVATDQYAYLRGLWSDGTSITVGGSGFWGEVPTAFMFPGDPVTESFWSEENTDGRGARNTPADRTFLMSTGPFTFQPGETQDVTFAIVWSQGTNRLASVAKLRQDVKAVRAFFAGGAVPSPPDPPPTEAPTLVSPRDDAAGIVTTPQFIWRPAGDSLFYLLHVDDDPAFGSPEVHQVIFNEPLIESRVDLDNEMTYYWRVRAENLGGVGPWSDVQTFTTTRARQSDLGFSSFEAVANAAGPIVPPTGAAADFQGFPVPERPDDRQQAGAGVWMINTGATVTGTSYDAFVQRSIRNGFGVVGRNDYEIRFTAACYDAWQAAHDAGTPFATPADGCYGYDRYGVVSDASDQPILVPFELWNIGGGTPDNPSDDFRMIPAVIDWEADGFNLQCVDSPASGADDDPESDWVYWYLPLDASPGETGYEAWAADLLAGTTPYTHGSEVMARIVWFNYNGGAVSACRLDNKATVFNQAMPEAGTVFRFVTEKPIDMARATSLTGLNVVPPTRSAAVGDFGLAGAPGAFTYTGAFLNLEGEFSSAGLYAGAAGTVGTLLAELPVDLSADGHSGTFAFDPAALAGVGEGGDLYVLIRTTAFPGGELRGQLLPPGNEAPDTTVPFTAVPALSLEGPGNTPFEVTWEPAPDPNANPVIYTWQLALDDDFTTLVVNENAGTATSLRLTYTQLERLLDAAGVPEGQEVTLYHRLLSSDGSLTRAGSTQVLRLTRGDVVATGTEHDGELPAQFTLRGNYPNPFNPVTTLVFDLPEAAQVRVEVYDLLGRRVLVGAAQPMAAGASRQLRLDGSRLASGVYFYRIEAKAAQTTWRETGRMVLMK